MSDLDFIPQVSWFVEVQEEMPYLWALWFPKQSLQTYIKYVTGKCVMVLNRKKYFNGSTIFCDI